MVKRTAAKQAAPRARTKQPAAVKPSSAPKPARARKAAAGAKTTVKSRPRRSVVVAVARDLKELETRAPALAQSTLAAAAFVLAAALDDPGNSATSKSMCARALRETMDRLRELAPAEAEQDVIDDLSARRRDRVAAR